MLLGWDHAADTIRANGQPATTLHGGMERQPIGALTPPPLIEIWLWLPLNQKG